MKRLFLALSLLAGCTASSDALASGASGWGGNTPTPQQWTDGGVILNPYGTQGVLIIEPRPKAPRPPR